MPKLFIALDLPPSATAELALIQPPALRGVQLEKRHHMHVTLHFLGQASIERTATALAEIGLPAFLLAFEGVGQFAGKDGAVILWAGVAASPALLALHAAIATALAGEGFQAEARPYTPHVTLARCGPQVDPRVVEAFLAAGTALTLPDLPTAEFGLYSSTSANGAPVYRRERFFPLQEPKLG